MQKLSREQGNMAKIKREEGNFRYFQEHFNVQILKCFCILACRVLNSALGLHDSIRPSWKRIFLLGSKTVCMDVGTGGHRGHVPPTVQRLGQTAPSV